MSTKNHLLLQVLLQDCGQFEADLIAIDELCSTWLCVFHVVLYIVRILLKLYICMFANITTLHLFVYLLPCIIIKPLLCVTVLHSVCVCVCVCDVQAVSISV